jgi:hypothetical protein
MSSELWRDQSLEPLGDVAELDVAALEESALRVGDGLKRSLRMHHCGRAGRFVAVDRFARDQTRTPARCMCNRGTPNAVIVRYRMAGGDPDSSMRQPSRFVTGDGTATRSRDPKLI